MPVTTKTHSQIEKIKDSSPLKALEFLVGHWTSVAATPDGTPIKRHIAYQWLHEGKFLSAESKRETGDQVISMNLLYLWDSFEKRIKTWVIGSDGSWNQAVVDIQEQEIQLNTTGITAEGYPISLTSSLTRTSEGSRRESWVDILVGGKPQSSPPAIIWQRVEAQSLV